MLATHIIPLPSSAPAPTNSHGFTNTKRKRKPAGTPDPDAEVVYLSPETLMESDRYVCEVCNLSFQREQNLQMHRRRHKLPWTLHKNERPSQETALRKRVYVCPEPSCVHHNPAHALGDLVGIKKHFRRKHTNHKQWVCEKCSKGYAVHSDYKAHLKTCGTRGHSCDCGRVFSRVETFIEHQDSCKARRKESGGRLQTPKPAFLPPPTSLMKPIFNLNLSVDPHSVSRLISERTNAAQDLTIFPVRKDGNLSSFRHTLELRELFPSRKNEVQTNNISIDDEDQTTPLRQVLRLRSETEALMRVAMEQKAMAGEKRRQAKCLIELANQDMTNASKIREQAIVTEIRNAQLLKDYSKRKMLINSSTGQQKLANNSCKVNCKEFQQAAQVKEVGHGFSCFPAVNWVFPSVITQGENGDNSLRFRLGPG